MNIIVHVKQLGARRDKIAGQVFPIKGEPATLRELICACVQTCVEDYNGRMQSGEMPAPLTDADVERMREAGKLAFGVNYGENKANLPKAIRTAIEGYEDGLFRVFRGDEELQGLDMPIKLQENDKITFIRFTMLAGSMF